MYWICSFLSLFSLCTSSLALDYPAHLRHTPEKLRKLVSRPKVVAAECSSLNPHCELDMEPSLEPPSEDTKEDSIPSLDPILPALALENIQLPGEASKLFNEGAEYLNRLAPLGEKDVYGTNAVKADYMLGVELLERASALAPTFNLFCVMADTYHDQNIFAERDALRQALHANARAQNRIRVGMPYSEEDASVSVLQVAPLLIRLANVWYELGEMEEAAETYEELFHHLRGANLERDDVFVNGCQNFALLQLERNLTFSSQTVAAQGIEVDPTNVDLLRILIISMNAEYEKEASCPEEDDKCLGKMKGDWRSLPHSHPEIVEALLDFLPGEIQHPDTFKSMATALEKEGYPQAAEEMRKRAEFINEMERREIESWSLSDFNVKEAANLGHNESIHMFTGKAAPTCAPSEAPH